MKINLRTKNIVFRHGTLIQSKSSYELRCVIYNRNMRLTKCQMLKRFFWKWSALWQNKFKFSSLLGLTFIGVFEISESGNPFLYNNLSSAHVWWWKSFLLTKLLWLIPRKHQYSEKRFLTLTSDRVKFLGKVLWVGATTNVWLISSFLQLRKIYEKTLFKYSRVSAE